jgi:hypothetical protein
LMSHLVVLSFVFAPWRLNLPYLTCILGIHMTGLVWKSD